MKAKRTEITIETERIVVISKPKLSAVVWCPKCCCRVRMITVDEAGTIAGVSSRTVYRWVEADQLHFAEMHDGRFLVCSRSLNSKKQLED